jgi:branched-subunit amino acid aminotransferase/4-amino-4-deoxychorismate lyase
MSERASSDPARTLFETLRIEDGRPVRGAAHLARLSASARALGVAFDPAAAATALTGAPPGTWRARLTLYPGGRLELERWPYHPDRPGTVVAVGWATETVRSGDPVRRHKTRDRGLYDRGAALAQARGWADALFLNERGEVVEGAISTLIAELDGVRLTPPVRAGALPGVLRATLLRRGLVREGAFGPDELARASRLWLASSLRGLRRARIATEPGASDAGTG